MSFKERSRNALEKVKFFFYKLSHPESRRRVVEDTKGVIGGVRNGALLYVKAGRIKMKKVRITTRLNECYHALGVRFVEMVRVGNISPDEDAKKFIDEINVLEEELTQVQEEERKSRIIKGDGV